MSILQGTLSDGTENTHLVGFTVVQQKLLSTYKETNKPLMTAKLSHPGEDQKWSCSSKEAPK